MFDEQLLRRVFDDAVNRSGTFGAQLSIIKAGQQFDIASGFANACEGVALRPDTLMQIGSVTKLFNAAIVMRLVEERLLDLDAPICSLLFGFQLPNPERARTLTLKHLLSMSSGLDNGPYAYYGAGEEALGRYVSDLKSLTQHFEPGRYFGYSNAGTCIAGYIASRVAGESWEALVRELILEPAALTQSAALDIHLLSQGLSLGHFRLSDGSVQTTIPIFDVVRARAPSGSTLALSAADLARFGQIFIDRGVADTGARILSDASIDLMMQGRTPLPTRKYGSMWCLGPHVADWNGHDVWGHGGTSLTATSFLHWIPEQKGVIALISNTHAAMGELSRIVFGDILHELFGFEKPSLDLPAQPGVAIIDPERYIGAYEELGMSMHVEPGKGNSLTARLIPRAKEYEIGVSREQTVSLAPFGGDRFMIVAPDGPSKHRGAVDMAFFGTDEVGRAKHALNLVFPMSRVE